VRAGDFAGDAFLLPRTSRDLAGQDPDSRPAAHTLSRSADDRSGVIVNVSARVVTPPVDAHGLVRTAANETTTETSEDHPLY
jgi:hypothetical protein